MINEITADTTPEEYSEVVTWCHENGYMIPDSPEKIAADERHEDNVRWIRDRAHESRIAACAAVMAAFLWAAAETPIEKITDATTGKVKEQRVLATLNPLGEVRDGLTPHQAGLDAERGLWLRPLGELS